MKDCTDCKWAEWDRTNAGRLHPSGEGKCKYVWKVPPLPASMYFLYSSDITPRGGNISRKVPLKDHCTYYVKKSK